MATPRAFVSYSHDSADHKAWVLKLASDLRANGIDVTLDQWDLSPGQDVSLFMQKGITESDRVVMVCSSPYVDKSEAGVGGVGFERLIVTAEVVASIDTKKFIPILRGSDAVKRIPAFLGPRMYVDFNNDKEYSDKLLQLVREIHGAPAISKPPIGPNPFSGTPSSSASSRTLGPTGSLLPGDKFLESEWFSQEEAKARSGIQSIGLAGSMDIRAGIIFPIAKSQIELLSAVRQSEIRTFGWPIGVTLENRDEFRPRPYGDGIKAEISIREGSLSRNSYDYWALRSSGDFFLLQSLFEDDRTEGAIFFDTRIVRVTETLMFLENLYTKLGVPPDTRVGVRIGHHGLKGRTLSAASSRRFIRTTQTLEDETATEIVTLLGKMRESRVDDVRKILEPVFMLFDFTQFDTSIYEDLVRGFERGEIR
jgi:hypothetical protein